MDKTVRQLIDRLRQFPDVTIDQRGDHPIVYKKGKFVTTLPSTPSKQRWMKNAIATLKRHQIDVHNPPRKEKSVLAPPVAAPPTPEPSMLNGRPTLTPDGTRFLTKQSNIELRRWVREFMETMFGYPATPGALARASRYLTQVSDPPFKNLNTTSVGLKRFLDGGGMSPESGEKLVRAIEEFDVELELEIQKKHEHHLKAKASENLEKANEARKAVAEASPPASEPVAPSQSKRKAGRLYDLHQRLAAKAMEIKEANGRNATARSPYGSSTMRDLGAQVIKQASIEGIRLSASSRSGGEITPAQVAKRFSHFLAHTKFESWFINEIELYVRLLEKEPIGDPPPFASTVERERENAPAQAATITVDDRFLDLVEGRALSRTQLTEARTIVASILAAEELVREMEDQLAEFNARHPRQ